MVVNAIEKFAVQTGIYTTRLNINMSPFDIFWFLRYGPLIMMATLIDILLSPIKILFGSLVSAFIQKKLIPKQKLQKGLLNILRPKSFSMEKVLPYLISFMLTCLALLPGMPLMMPCLFFLFLFQFFVQKYLLIKKSSLPKFSHENTLRVLIKGVPLALMIPLGAGIMIYTNFYNSQIDNFIKCTEDGYCDPIHFLVNIRFNKLF